MTARLIPPPLLEQHAAARLQCFKSLGLRPVVNSQRLCPKSRQCDWLLPVSMKEKQSGAGPHWLLPVKGK